jgi:hypothetical protein
MRKNYFVLLLVIIIIAGCSSNAVKKPVPVPDSRTTYVTTPDEGIPEWYLYPPKAEDGVYGAGQSTKNGPTLGEMKASANARVEIAQYLSVFIEAMLKDYLREAGIGETASINSLTEFVSKTLTQADLKGSRIEKRAVVGDTWYVLVFYDDAKAIKLMTETAEAEMRKQEALYNEWLSKRGHEDLEKEMKEHFGEYKKNN